MQSKVMLNKNSDNIFISDLMLEMSVGIYDHEKEDTQPVVVNITIEVESNKGRQLESIDSVISYEEVVKSITVLSKKKHYNLLEEFAENIACICLEHKNSIKVKVSVDKPDIMRACKTVGIEIIRF